MTANTSLAAAVGPAQRQLLTTLGDLALVLSGLGLYARTLAPTVLPADSGEFQLVSYVLGIAHPPGYPLYTLLGKLFTFLPINNVAWRVNLLSAVIGTATLWVVSRCVRLVTGSSLAGWLGAAYLGVATTFWAQATTANIRSLTVLLVAVQIYQLLAYERTGGQGHLIGFAFALGLGVSHHSSMVPLALPYLVFILLCARGESLQWRIWIKPAVAFVAGLLVLLYLPLRSRMNPAFDPAPIRTLGDFTEHVLALGFRGDMFYFVRPQDLLARVRVFSNILNLQFPLPWLLLGSVGAVCLLLCRRRIWLLVGGVFCVNSLLALTYRAPQTVEYLMPAYLALCIMSAYGLWELVRRLESRHLRAACWLVATVIVLFAFRARYPSYVEQSSSHAAHSYAVGVLDAAPAGATVLSNWHYATPMWYMQLVEGLRPDVKVEYVYPEGAEPIAETWLRRLGQSAEIGPTLVTNQYPEFRNTAYLFAPLGGAYLVSSGHMIQLPEDISGLHALLGERIELIGYTASPLTLGAADTVSVRVYWTPRVKLDRDYSVFVHLVGGDGVPIGQGDTRHAAAQYEPGQVILDEYQIPLLPTVRPGQYRLVAGVYFTPAEGGWQRLVTADGRDTVHLAGVEVTPSHTAPVTQHNIRARSSLGYTLLGVDYDRSVPDQLRIYLHWRADRNLNSAANVLLWSQGDVVDTVGLPLVPQGAHFSTVSDVAASVTDIGVELQTPEQKLRGMWWMLGVVPAGHRLTLPTAVSSSRYVPLGSDMVLVGVKYPGEAKAGEAAKVELSFLAARPITSDYTVSVSLNGPDGAFWAQHDGTPAMGAIPTLKWIRGDRISDEHPVVLPATVAGSGRLWLTVYDAFTIRPLPVLDERLARLGQGTQLELGSVQVR